GAGGGIGIEDRVGMGIEQQRRLDRELERGGMEIDVMWSSRRAESKIHHTTTPRFRNHATNFRLSRILVAANISTKPCDISAIAEERGWHVPCLIREQRRCRRPHVYLRQPIRSRSPSSRGWLPLRPACQRSRTRTCRAGAAL